MTLWVLSPGILSADCTMVMLTSKSYGHVELFESALRLHRSNTMQAFKLHGDNVVEAA